MPAYGILTALALLSQAALTAACCTTCHARLARLRQRQRGAVEHSMAQKIQVLFIDDIDGGEAEGTVRFALNGTEYEIDLSAKHSDERLRDPGSTPATAAAQRNPACRTCAKAPRDEPA